MDELHALGEEGYRADIILVDLEKDKKLSMLKQLIVALVKGLNSNPAAIIKKITDFGVSEIMESASGQANTFIGTYNYMSSERINGGQSGYNYKSDIWSLGLILLECAMGRFP